MSDANLLRIEIEPTPVFNSAITYHIIGFVPADPSVWLQELSLRIGLVPGVERRFYGAEANDELWLNVMLQSGVNWQDIDRAVLAMIRDFLGRLVGVAPGAISAERVPFRGASS